MNGVEGSAKDPDPLDPQDFGFLDPDPQKYADPWIRIKGVNINQKRQKKLFNIQNPNMNF